MKKLGSFEKFKIKNEVEIRQEVDKFTPVFQSILKEHGIQRLIETAYSYIDQINTGLKINEKISCSTGCAHCCYADISISKNEASLIHTYVAQFNIEVNKEVLKKQQSKKFYKLKYAEKRCALLGKDDVCNIYEVRPALCRLWNSTSEPIRCYDKHKAINTITLRVITAWAVSFALHEMDRLQGMDKAIFLHQIIKI